MRFEQQGSTEQFGRVIGFVLSYALFTAICFLLLSFTDRLPTAWSPAHVAGITFLVVLVGMGLRRALR